jgi:hypothetical protein
MRSMPKAVRRCLGVTIPLALGLTACSQGDSPGNSSPSPPDKPTHTRTPDPDPRKLGYSEDRLPSRTATSWVTYADHVLVITVTGEREKVPPAPATGRQEIGTVGRSVNVRVDRVLWSRPGATKRPPRAFTWEADGWEFRSGDVSNRRESAIAGLPRLEVGHTYIHALAWEPPMCSTEDGRSPGAWFRPGSGSVLPYDQGTIGRGEMEGTVRTVAQARATTPELADFDFYRGMLGRSGDDLRRTLDRTPPGKREQYGPRPEDYPCD